MYGHAIDNYEQELLQKMTDKKALDENTYLPG